MVVMSRRPAAARVLTLPAGAGCGVWQWGRRAQVPGTPGTRIQVALGPWGRLIREVWRLDWTLVTCRNTERIEYTVYNTQLYL